jgi:pimeloyl-ACP methyl ester carboxylesterase
LAATWVFCAVARAEPPRRSFTLDQRRCIDDNALWSPREKLDPARIEAPGSVLEWLVVHTPLPAEEERRRADEEYRQFVAKFRSSEPPAPAQAIFDQLAARLPVRMLPWKDPLRLSTAEDLEPSVRQIGAGNVFVDRAWLEAVLADQGTGRDQLAFAVASELGHACLGHSRRRMQRAWLEEELQKDAERKSNDREKTLEILKNLRGVGALLEHVYTREEEFQADLFAIHLCRNAGFDVENCLDAVRAAAVQSDRGLLAEPPSRSGSPPVEPEVQPQTGREAVTLAQPPPAAHRLRRLRLELDGLLFGDNFGLFEFIRETMSFRRAADASVPADARAVVCIHGMESNREVYRPLFDRLAADDAAAQTRLFVFQYPNDDSLARSGRALERELRRVFASMQQTDFVCHSAGGLVFRYYAEARGGEFRRTIFLGTPHGGSNLARLRRLLEAVQFVGDLNLGYDQALQAAILDGRGQMTFDLEPDSLFLGHLNRPRDNLHRDRYVIHRGRAFTRTRALLLQAAVDSARTALARSLGKREDSTLRKFGLAATDVLVMPPEIADGDLCVRSDSALLEGVEQVTTHSLKHTALPRDADVISRVLQQLSSAP